eukprot:15430337-Alexandrium_andersonii.AAC.1
MANPVFSVAIDGEDTEFHSQQTGIRQGCTLSPLLFIIILSVVMEEVTLVVTFERPLLLTPVFNFFDIEFADDTALVCKTAQSMQCVLHAVQKEASEWGLYLNKSKTVELAINSPTRIRFLDGDLVPRGTSAKYLGTIMHYRGDPTEE